MLFSFSSRFGQVIGARIHAADLEDQHLITWNLIGIIHDPKTNNQMAQKRNTKPYMQSGKRRTWTLSEPTMPIVKLSRLTFLAVHQSLFIAKNTQKWKRRRILIEWSGKIVFSLAKAEAKCYWWDHLTINQSQREYACVWFVLMAMGLALGTWKMLVSFVIIFFSRFWSPTPRCRPLCANKSK